MPWLQQPFPVKVSHIYAMTSIGRGLLIESVPVAAAHAAHNFLLSFHRNHKASSLHRSGTSLSPWCGLVEKTGLARGILCAHPSREAILDEPPEQRAIVALPSPMCGELSPLLLVEYLLPLFWGFENGLQHGDYFGPVKELPAGKVEQAQW